jgi:hypothetical protein
MAFIRHPSQWLWGRALYNASHQRRVGSLRICASVDVTASLKVFLHVAFRAPQLTPMKAVDLLEAFLRETLPLLPNTEWEVRIDERQWIHFSRLYAQAPLAA